MTTRKWILGKVFVSHSSKDKPFVRRLARRLWKDGYQVWLDEKELVPGDALGARLSDALKQSRVVIAVVTENSINSKWLAFELNKAIERMVEGECRIIPVLKGDVEPLVELKGLIYADFRKSFANGFKAVRAALQKAADDALSHSWQELDAMAEHVFGFQGFVSLIGEYETLDYNYLQIDGLKDPRRPADDACIVYEVVHDYGHRREPLGSRWWDEYRSVQERFGEIYHLVVSERPIDIRVATKSNQSARVKTYVDTAVASSPFVVVFADVSGLSTSDEKVEELEHAKDEFMRIGSELWPAKAV